MIGFFQKRYELTREGAVNLLKGIIATILQNLSFILPVMLSSVFIKEQLDCLLTGGPSPQHGLWFYLAGAVIIMAVIYLASYWQYSKSFCSIYEESAKSRIKLAETLRKLPLAFFGKKDVADLSSTIMEDATQIETLFSHCVPQLYSAGFTVTLMAIMMFAFSWQLSLTLFWVVPVMLILFFSARSQLNRNFKKLYDMKRAIADTMQDGMDMAQLIKSYNGEAAYTAKLDRLLDDYERALIKIEFPMATLMNVCHVILHLGLPTLLIWGGHLLLNGAVSVFTFLIFTVIAARVYNPILEVTNNYAMLLYMDVRIQRIRDMHQMPRQTGREDFAPQQFDIVFDNVSFSYQDDQETLRNVSFLAKQGEVTALVGPSGGGKSTIAKLAARFWDIDAGQIRLDGQDIGQIDPETLLTHYAIVFQDVALFDASVMENIRLGKKDATDEEVMRAAKLAQCDEFVTRLPQGYDTGIGENGERLSGGERQRISIARALLKDAPIILLDEATASIDTENESKIQQALSTLVKNKTVIIIAHRMRTIKGADKVVVVKDGRIVEMGTPRELEQQQGLFSTMLKTQNQAG